MNHNQIIIFSQPIRTGKTTTLEKWIERKTNIGGILTPDTEKRRVMKNLSNGAVIPFEVQPGETGITVGKFTFSEKAFLQAATILQEARLTKEIVIVDEVGKLEVENSTGLHSAVIDLLQNDDHVYKTLILVVRDYLLAQAIEKYNLQNAEIVDASFFSS